MPEQRERFKDVSDENMQEIMATLVNREKKQDALVEDLMDKLRFANSQRNETRREILTVNSEIIRREENNA